MSKKIKRIDEEVAEKTKLAESGTGDVMSNTEIVVNNGIVMVKEKGDIVEDMEEVTYEEWRKMSQSSSPQKTILSAIKNLAGKTKDEAIEALNSWVEAKEIGSYRVLPVGGMYSAEYVADRVQLVVDSSGQVLDANVG
jgi:hypothetical protein